MSPSTQHPVVAVRKLGVLEVAVGVVAAVLPARRGSRVDILDALHQE